MRAKTIILLQTNFDLQTYNTFGIAAVAVQFAEIKRVEAIQPLLSNPERPEHLLILGGGSNLLLPDLVPGLVLHNNIKFIEVERQLHDEVILRVGGGVNWHELVLWSLRNGYGGLENMALIPGTVGAAPIQNIGAYGRELKDVFVALECQHLATGKLLEFTAQDCQFGYRDSFFKQKENRNQYFITSVSLRLTQRQHQLYTHYGAIQQQLSSGGISTPTPQDVAAAVIEIRRSKLPDWRKFGNAGSFFKNPVIDQAHFALLSKENPQLPSYPAPGGMVKVPAAWLIDQCGWKGRRRGAVGCYENQALVIVNHGGATAAQVLSFSREIVSDVKTRFGIELEREVNAWQAPSE